MADRIIADRFYETSALNGQNVSLVFKLLASAITEINDNKLVRYYVIFE